MTDVRRRPRLNTADPVDLLPVVAARLSRLYAKVLGQLSTPLTYRQFRTLVRVRDGHRTLVALAQFSNLSMPTVSENVDGLVRRGLLDRREHPDDRRSVLLQLTPLGVASCQEAHDAVKKVSADLLHDIPERSRATLGRALASVFDAATTYVQGDDS